MGELWNGRISLLLIGNITLIFYWSTRQGLLSTISSKRAEWYLARNLAVSLGAQDGYADKVQLTFTPKKNSSNAFLQSILPSRCVVCGAETGLTVHHVVPMAIKRYFPEADKNHTRQWCVLVCGEHHAEAEKTCRPIYEESLQNAVTAASKRSSDGVKGINRLIYVLDYQRKIILNILGKKDAGGVSREFIRVAMDSISNISALLRIGQKELDSIKASRKENLKNAKKEWAEKFISNSGGIEKLKEKFKNAFFGARS